MNLLAKIQHRSAKAKHSGDYFNCLPGTTDRLPAVSCSSKAVNNRDARSGSVPLLRKPMNRDDCPAKLPPNFWERKYLRCVVPLPAPQSRTNVLHRLILTQRMVQVSNDSSRPRLYPAVFAASRLLNRVSSRAVSDTAAREIKSNCRKRSGSSIRARCVRSICSLSKGMRIASS